MKTFVFIDFLLSTILEYSQARPYQMSPSTIHDFNPCSSSDSIFGPDWLCLIISYLARSGSNSMNLTVMTYINEVIASKYNDGMPMYESIHNAMVSIIR